MFNRLATIQRLAAVLTLCAGVLVGLPGLADSLQREGSPLIDGVILIGVKDGKLQYRTGGSDKEIALAEIVSISVDSVPELAAGLASLKEGELRSAQRSLENVWSNTRVDWIKHFAGFYLTQVYDQRGEAVDAATVYAKLAAEGAELHFLSKAPVASLAEADENQKQRIGEEIMAVIKDTEGDRRTLLRAYQQRVLGEDAPLPEIDDPTGRKTSEANALIANSKVILPQDVWDMMEREDRFEGEWDAIELIANGDAAGALKSIEPSLNAPGDLPEKLFLKGVAQRMLADQEQDEDLYRDAGLTFMRIVVHFSRAGQSHPLVAPAQLEVAYVHKQIDREDIYNRILFGGDAGGGVHLVIDDAEEYPHYRKRYYDIIGEELPEEDQP